MLSVQWVKGKGTSVNEIELQCIFVCLLKKRILMNPKTYSVEGFGKVCVNLKRHADTLCVETQAHTNTLNVPLK